MDRKTTSLEKEIEQYLSDRVRRLGGLCFKFVSPGRAGVPDRIVLYKGSSYFVELKRPKGGKLSEIQTARHKEFSAHGFQVWVLKNRKEVDEFVAYIQASRISEERHKVDS